MILMIIPKTHADISLYENLSKKNDII